ncbi:MAG: hypothetical protein ACJAWS_003161 [Oleiphilaceae bacterium]|jgi:hypothetical protein
MNKYLYKILPHQPAFVSLKFNYLRVIKRGDFKFLYYIVKKTNFKIKHIANPQTETKEFGHQRKRYIFQNVCK